jgi:predicted ABC-type ATPase
MRELKAPHGETMPTLLLIGGPNGAGKTTSASHIVPDVLRGGEFVNADVIAAGLSSLNPMEVSFEAGRMMLRRIQELIALGNDLAFETTFASRSLVNVIRNAKDYGYSIALVYLWLSSPGLAIERVANRVRHGGHDIPDDVITRRYHRGLSNLVHMYLPLADDWQVYDNSGRTPVLVADGTRGDKKVYNDGVWEKLNESAQEKR